MLLDFFNKYQIETIAFLVILLLVIAFAIYKLKGKKNKNVIDDPYDDGFVEDESVYSANQTIVQKNENEVIKDEFDTEQEEEEIKEHNEALEKENKNIEEHSTKNDEPNQPVKQPSKIKKRAVPQHGKISKDDFKVFEGKRILLAEDNIINQKVILGLLADSGIDVVIANDGQEVLDILENDTNFALILMDAHMPNLDGFGATRLLRKSPEYDHIAVIALSGDTASDDVKKMLDAGMSEHLEKPLKMDALYDVLYAYNNSTGTKELDTLDTEEGLEVCGGDTKFYRDILIEFATKYKDSSKRLQTLINSKDMKSADKLLLDVIGVSANIGAKKLNQTTQDFKIALANRKNIASVFKQYHQDLQALIKEIKQYIN